MVTPPKPIRTEALRKQLMWKQVLVEAGTEDFGDKLEEAISRQNMTVKEFAKKHDISESNIYKITSGETVNFGVQTLRKIIKALQEEEGYDSPTVGLITTRSACDRAPSEVTADETKYNIKPLPANSIEEEIIKGVNAERDGIDAILCGPIAATTIEKVVNVPVGGLQFDEDLMETSLRSLVKRIET
jgi:predicted transcriptional regulator